MMIPVLIVVAIGLVCAVILTIASKVFFVPVDETFALLRAELPALTAVPAAMPDAMIMQTRWLRTIPSAAPSAL